MEKQNVSAAKPQITGAIYHAPAGTTLPTDAKSKLDDAFKELGYVGEDGVSNTNTPEHEEIKAWGGVTVLSHQTDKKDEYKFKLIEALNTNVLKVIYGDDNVTGDIETGITITANSKEHEEECWVIDMILRDGVLKRTVIPYGKVVTVDEIPYKDNEAIGYGVTLALTPDTAGNTHYEYIVKK